MSLSEKDPGEMTREELVEYCYSLEALLESQNEMRSAENVSKLKEFFGLTPKEAAMLAALADGRIYTKEHLLMELYSGRDEPEIKIIDVFVCKLRAKVSQFGIEVQTVWGTGYKLANPELLEKVLAGEELAAVEHPPEVPPRQAGTKPNRYGGYQAEAARWLSQQPVDQHGRITFFPRDLAKVLNVFRAGSSIVRGLERGGYLTVVRPAGPRGGLPWIVALTDKGREALA